MKHWQIELACVDSDEFAWMPVSFGASGVEILTDSTLRAFFSGDDSSLDEFLNTCSENNFQLLTRTQIIPENWTQRCEELMETIEIGELRVVPVSSAEYLPEVRTAKDIYLIPGSGFGTGHHITTEMALRLLQHEAVKELRPKRVFDLGTGSGLLAIAAVKLYTPEVHAVDISADALVNAEDNAHINTMSGIRFQQGSISLADGPYDVFCSNLFAELLCEFSESIRDQVRPGGLLILSGILPELRSNVQSTYAMPTWEVIEESEEFNWCSFLLRRVNGEK